MTEAWLRQDRTWQACVHSTHFPCNTCHRRSISTSCSRFLTLGTLCYLSFSSSPSVSQICVLHPPNTQFPVVSQIVWSCISSLPRGVCLAERESRRVHFFLSVLRISPLSLWPAGSFKQWSGWSFVGGMGVKRLLVITPKGLRWVQSKSWDRRLLFPDCGD